MRILLRRDGQCEVSRRSCLSRLFIGNSSLALATSPPTSFPMETRSLSLPSAAWTEAERRAAASCVSIGEAVAAALLASPAPPAKTATAEAKRHRAEPTVGRAARVPAPTPSDWAQLPEEISMQVFRQLTAARDQGAVRATCKSWIPALAAVVTSVGITELGAVTSERTGRWQRLCPAAEELSVSVRCSRVLLADIFANTPGLRHLKRLSLKRDDYSYPWAHRYIRRDSVASIEALSLQSFRSSDMDAMLRPDEGLGRLRYSDPAGLLKFPALRKLELAGNELEPGHLETLGKMVGLEELKMVGVHNWDNGNMGLDWLGQLTRLKRLEFSCHSGLLVTPAVGDEDDDEDQALGDLHILGQLTGLEHLDLSGLNPYQTGGLYETLTGDEVAESLLRMPKLKSFASSFCDNLSFVATTFREGLTVTDPLVWALVQLPCLERLVLSGHKPTLSPAGVEALGQLQALTELLVATYLTPHRGDGLVSDAFLEALRPLTSLQTLELDMPDNLCSSNTLTATLKKMSSLSSLTLNYDNLVGLLGIDDEVETLPDGWEDQVPVLDLSFVTGTPQLRIIKADESFLLVKNLGALQNAPRLESMVVSGMWDSKVLAGSLSVEELRGLKKLTRLETLDIDRAHIDDDHWSHSLDNYGDEAVRKAWTDLKSLLGPAQS